MDSCTIHSNHNKTNKVAKRNRIIIPLLLFILSYLTTAAQQTGKVLFTTSVGVINGQGNFGKAFKSTFAFNSGVELTLKDDWFGQFVFDFNALKYDQQFRDASSPFLFQNTNSSLLLLGLNIGKNFHFTNRKWFTSLYSGLGYLNIGEPRITINNNLNLAKQDNVRKNSAFGRIGSRIAHITQSSFFQTVYIDASYWVSPVKVQAGTVNGISLYLGTRFGIQ